MEPTRAHADNPNQTRCGATVDINGTWTDVYFDTTRERADWLSWMDLGVRELIDPDGTRYAAVLDDNGTWQPANTD